MGPILNRRGFLRGAGSIGVGLLPARSLAQRPTGHNGGRSQVNLNSLQISGDFAFINLLKTAQSWSFIDDTGPPPPDMFDRDGYPILISHGGVYTVFYVPSQAARPGNYVISWEGNGTVFCGMSNVRVRGSKTSRNGSGRYEFSTKDTRFVVGVESIGSPHISNLKVFHASDEDAINAGEVFGIKFKERLREANFGVIRFLNWQSGNLTNVTTWASCKPQTYAFYAAKEFRSSIYAGSTTNSGSAYRATLPGFELVDKAMVIVKFNASNTSACTLNMNGTGDIKILDQYTNPLSARSNSFPEGGTWRSLATLVYDADVHGWIKQGGDLALGSSGIDNGVPPELMVRLCAEVGAHPYFVAPPLAVDPMTDYVSKLATYCRDNGPSWMIPRFEGPNELWNFAPGFNQTGYASAKSAIYGWAGYHDWYGKAMSTIGQAVSAVYAADRTRYQVLCGVQTATGKDVHGTASSDRRLSSAAYVARAAAAQFPYTKSAASAWVTHVCCAQYFSPPAHGTDQEAKSATRYAAAVSDPNLQNAIANAYAETVQSGSGPFTLTSCAALYANWKMWAQRFGIKMMCGYEGGYSPDYTSVGNSELDRLRAGSKGAPNLISYTLTNYGNFVGLTDKGFVAEYPSCYVFSSNINLGGSSYSRDAWAVLEDIYQTPNPPQWTAIVAFNH